jgi:hypothetical protein
MSDDLRYKIGLDGAGAQRTLRDLIGGVGGLSAKLTGLGDAAGFTSLLKRGMEFNQTMGDSEVAIGNVLQQMAGLNAEAAKAEAAKAMQQLIELEPKVTGSLTDLVQGFMATLGASQSAGINIKENIDLVGKFANALGNSAIPAHQLSQEMRSIVTANIGADSSLAKVLQISNDDIKTAREAGNLYQFLVGKIGTLGEAGDTAAVAFSSLQSAMDKAAGALTKGIFQQAVAGGKDLMAVINDNEKTFESMGVLASKALAGVIYGVKELAGPLRQAAVLVDHLGEGFGYLGGIAAALAQGFTLDEAIKGARRTGDELRNATREAGGLEGAMHAAGDAASLAMKKTAAEAKQAAQKVQAAAGGALRGDKDGDGIISKREQRKLDFEDKRAQQKADSIKGFSGKRLGLDLGFGGSEAAGLAGAINLTGPNEGKKAFSNLWDIGGTAALKQLRANGGDVVQGALARLRNGEDVTKGLGATGSFALPKAAVNANLRAAANADAKNKPPAQDQVIGKLDDIKGELERIRTS